MTTIKIETGAVIMPAMRLPLLMLVPGDVLSLQVSEGMVYSGELSWTEEALTREINSGLWWFHSASGVSNVTQKAHPGIIKAVKILSVRIAHELKDIIHQFAVDNKEQPVGELDIEPIDISVGGDIKKRTPYNNFSKKND